MPRIIIVLSAIIFTVSTIVLADDEIEMPNWGEIESWEWDYQPPAEYQDADAVVLFDYGRVEVELRGKQFKRHIRIKVFKPEKISTISTPIYRKGDLRDISMTYYIDPESTFTPEEYFYNEHEAFQWCNAVMSIEDVQDQGFIVELKYTIDYDSTYIPPWYFDSDWFTLKSVYQVSIGGCYNYSYWSENIPEEKSIPVETRGGGLVGSFYRVFNWQLNDVTPYNFDDDKLVRREISPIVYFMLRFHGNTTLSEMEQYTNIDNAEIAVEFIPFMESYLRKSNGKKKLIKEAVTGIEGKYEKAAAIYKYVCNNIETLPCLKIDEYNQKSIEKLIESDRGTVLEKSYLLIKMLEVIDVEAWPVLISTVDHGSYNIQYPDLRQLNHIIVRAEINPGEYIFCDLSQAGTEFGELPENMNVTGGLLIHDKKPGPVRVSSK